MEVYHKSVVSSSVPLDHAFTSDYPPRLWYPTPGPAGATAAEKNTSHYIYPVPKAKKGQGHLQPLSWTDRSYYLLYGIFV